MIRRLCHRPRRGLRYPLSRVLQTTRPEEDLKVLESYRMSLRDESFV